MSTEKTNCRFKTDNLKADKAINVLLVNLPYVSYSLLDGLFKSPEAPEIPLLLDIPLGLLYLSSYAKQYSKRDLDIRLLDINKELYQILKERQETRTFSSAGGINEQLNSIITRKLCEFRFDIIGINILFATTQQLGIVVSQILKNLYPDAYIVGGGVQATNTYHSIIAKGSFDAIIRGEGEIAFTELLDMYMPGKKEYPIPGLMARQDIELKNAETTAVLPEELDKIPFPDYDLLKDIDSYVTELGALRTQADRSLRAWPLYTTRGCPKRCTFCASHSVHGRTIRARSLEDIYAEIEVLISKFKINTLLIVDDIFTFDRDRTIEFCREAIKRRWDLRIEFTSGVAIWTLDKEVIGMLAEAGARVINIAIESGSPYVQKHIIKKNLNLDQAREVAEIIARDHPDIECRSFYVIGFPGEKWEHICQTREFAKSIPQDWGVFQLAMPLPGSELFQQCLKLGYIKEDGNFDDYCKSTLNRTFDTLEFSKEELEDIKTDLNIEINFFSNKNMLSGNHQKALSIFRKIVETYPFHIIARYCVYYCLKQLNQPEESRKELEAIFYWIKKDSKSRKLYDRYRQSLKLPEGLETKLEGIKA